MALPTAQLGQLGNMSMPYSIPTYDRGPNIWEKALASFLVNAAGTAATKGVDNAMARDYAGDFGQKDATGFSKLVNGPRIGADEAKQRRAEAFTGDQNALEIQARAGQADADAANQLLRLDRTQQGSMDEQQLRDMNALVRGDREITAGAAHDKRVITGQNARDFNDRQARMDALDREYQLKGQMPDQQLHQVIVDRMKGNGLIKGTTGGNAAAGVNPNIASFASGDGAPAPARPSAQGYDFPAEPQFVSNADDVANMLAAGKTPEEILNIVKMQQQVNQAAQAKPLPGITTMLPGDRPLTNPYQDNTGAQQSVNPELLQLLQQLGLSQRPFSGAPDGLGIYGNR